MIDSPLFDVSCENNSIDKMLGKGRQRDVGVFDDGAVRGLVVWAGNCSKHGKGVQDVKTSLSIWEEEMACECARERDGTLHFTSRHTPNHGCQEVVCKGDCADWGDWQRYSSINMSLALEPHAVAIVCPLAPQLTHLSCCIFRGTNWCDFSFLFAQDMHTHNYHNTR